MKLIQSNILRRCGTFVLCLFCTFTSLASAEEPPWDLGLLVCLTGACAVDGENAVNGVKLAVAEINAAGGVFGRKVSTTIEDTAESTNGVQALSAFRKMRAAGVQYFVGPSWTAAGMTIAPVAAKEPVIITSPSLGAKEFHEAGDNIFNLRGTDEAGTRASARYAIEQGWKRGAVFSSQHAWDSLQGQYFKDEFEKLGGTIVAYVEPVPTITSLASEALRLTSKNPDVIFLAVYMQLSIAAKELRKLDYRGHKLAAFIDAPHLAEADGALDGACFMGFGTPSDEFAAKYRSRFGSKAEMRAAIAYDTVYLYKKAVEQARTFDPETVKKTLPQIRFTGASGPIALDAGGCIVRQPIAWTIKNGALERSLPAENQSRH